MNLQVAPKSPKTFKIHRLVAKAFLGPRPPGLETNHINGIKTDNRIENLEYVTHAENMRHAHDVLNVIAPTRQRGDAHWKSRLTAKDVAAIRETYDGARGAMTRLAERYGVSLQHIIRIVKRQSWRHVG